MSQAGNFLWKVLFLELTYSSYALIIRDGYLTGHLFCSLVHEPASPPALLVNCGMLLDIKPHETHGHCQLCTRVSKSTSVKLEQFIIVFCRWGSFFMQVELFLLAKEPIFSQLALNSSGKVFLVRLMPFFSSAHGKHKYLSSVYFTEIHLEAQDTSVLGGREEESTFSTHLFLYSSVLCLFTSCSPHICGQLLIFCMSRQPSA